MIFDSWLYRLTNKQQAYKANSVTYPDIYVKSGLGSAVTVTASDVRGPPSVIGHILESTATTRIAASRLHPVR
jgi:hypothetical protein